MDAWGALQQREQNLRSFQRQSVAWRIGSKHVPRVEFEPWQIAVAVGVLERGEAA